MVDLFYIIGGSGAGKDSLIDFVQKNLPDNTHVKYVQRYITRSDDAGGENHIALTEDEFLRMKSKNCFAMDWFSHDTHYGIGIEIKNWMSAGFSIIMNGSRGYLQQAATNFPNLVPVLISVDPDILSERLFLRGRENYSEIQKRITQAIKLESSVAHPRLQIIENNGALEHAGEKLFNLITNQAHNKCA